MMMHLPQPIRVFVWGPLAVALALAPLALTQVLQAASVVLMPVSMRAFRRVNTTIAGGLWGYWAWALQNVNGTRIEVDGDALPDREDAIVFCNHRMMGDIVVLMALAARHGRVGHLKWLVKDVVKWVPGVGWGMFFLDCVFLKRDWTRDEGTLRRVFSRIADNRLPVWLMSFPEGTRSTPKKMAAGQEWSRSRGAEPYQHLLPPRASGFAASVFALREHVQAVYSVTIVYDREPTLTGMMRGDLQHVRLNVRRFPVANLPPDKDGLGKWLEAEFRAKDALLAQASGGA